MLYKKIRLVFSSSKFHVELSLLLAIFFFHLLVFFSKTLFEVFLITSFFAEEILFLAQSTRMWHKSGAIIFVRYGRHQSYIQ